MTERLLDIRGLSAGYNGVPVVRDLDLHVGAGEIVALLGANGAGKTTTLLTVSGLNPGLDGEIDLFGTPVRGMRPHRIARAGLAHVLDLESIKDPDRRAQCERRALRLARALMVESRRFGSITEVTQAARDTASAS